MKSTRSIVVDIWVKLDPDADVKLEIGTLTMRSADRFWASVHLSRYVRRSSIINRAPGNILQSISDHQCSPLLRILQNYFSQCTVSNSGIFHRRLRSRRYKRFIYTMALLCKTSGYIEQIHLNSELFDLLSTHLMWIWNVHLSLSTSVATGCSRRENYIPESDTRFLWAYKNQWI